MSGNEANVSLDNDKQTVIALREIADKKLDLNKIWENIIANAQKYQPAEDADIDEDQAVQPQMKMHRRYRLIILKRKMLQKRKEKDLYDRIRN